MVSCKGGSLQTINTMFNELITNQILTIPIFAWSVAQFLKVVVVLQQKKRLDFRYFVISGGMPSSHSTFVSALATAIAFSDGLGSVTFAIAVIFAFVVMYDAAGIRHSVGQQAVVLNRLLREIGERRPATVLGRDFRELIGHTPFQVLVGGLLGIGIATLWISITGV